MTNDTQNEQDEQELNRIVDRLLETLRPEIGGQGVVSATWRRHSNDVGRIELEDGRVLMVKVGRFDWVARRFRAERTAARWLDEQGIVAPRHLDAPEEIEGRPVVCYWRIELHTLLTLWPEAGAGAERSALRGWGRLLRRVHNVPAEGCGPLTKDADERVPVESYLRRDLAERLRPAIAGRWPAALGVVDAALEALPRLVAQVGGGPSVLLHGDPHAGNVMGRRENGGVLCEGLIDLETAAAGPREFDLARVRVLHGPLFAAELPDGWFEELQRGYGVEPDPFALEWFAIYHMLNMGFYSALVGDAEHAAVVAEDAAGRAAELERVS